MMHPLEWCRSFLLSVSQGRMKSKSNAPLLWMLLFNECIAKVWQCPDPALWFLPDSLSHSSSPLIIIVTKKYSPYIWVLPADTEIDTLAARLLMFPYHFAFFYQILKESQCFNQLSPDILKHVMLRCLEIFKTLFFLTEHAWSLGKYNKPSRKIQKNFVHVNTQKHFVAKCFDKPQVLLDKTQPTRTTGINGQGHAILLSFIFFTGFGSGLSGSWKIRLRISIKLIY